MPRLNPEDRPLAEGVAARFAANLLIISDSFGRPLDPETAQRIADYLIFHAPAREQRRAVATFKRLRVRLHAARRLES